MPCIAIAVRLRRSTRAAATGAWRSRAARTRLLSDARPCFGKVAPDHPAACQKEPGHRRKATRTATAVSARGLAEHHDFHGLKGLGRIGSTRGTDGRLQSGTRWFALSWLPATEVLLTAVRAHRATRNALRRQLDVTFREGAARNRKDNGSANIAVLHRRAPDIARRDTSKGPLSIKLKRAGWDDDFLLSLLRQLQAQ